MMRKFLAVQTSVKSRKKGDKLTMGFRDAWFMICCCCNMLPKCRSFQPSFFPFRKLRRYLQSRCENIFSHIVVTFLKSHPLHLKNLGKWDNDKRTRRDQLNGGRVIPQFFSRNTKELSQIYEVPNDQTWEKSRPQIRGLKMPSSHPAKKLVGSLLDVLNYPNSKVSPGEHQHSQSCILKLRTICR